MGEWVGGRRERRCAEAVELRRGGSGSGGLLERCQEGARTVPGRCQANLLLHFLGGLSISFPPPLAS